MFVDRLRIWARAGNGGNGCSSFRREAFVPEGGPDGGDGGKGGSVVLRVNPHLNNLNHLRYKPHQFAEKGNHGKGANRTGRSGKDLIVEVPPGTVVSELPASEESWDRSVAFEEAVLLTDLIREDEEYVLSKGGGGGRGNTRFKTSTNQAPRDWEPGEPGEKGQFMLELKSIADIGLVGFPNAGKSSLLRAVSAAHPKVASYPFTTLTPSIGVVESLTQERFTVADIPGLIEGAHAGVGLGHDFLRHIERCSVLAFVIDMAGSEGRDPMEDYQLLRKEVKLFSTELAERPHLVVANKMDLPEAETHLAHFKTRCRTLVCAISVEEKIGIDPLKDAFREKIVLSTPDSIT
ncbi:MAG: GTPase ObgE [Verrucomicrobiota bacterium]